MITIKSPISFIILPYPRSNPENGPAIGYCEINQGGAVVEDGWKLEQ